MKKSDKIGTAIAAVAVAGMLAWAGTAVTGTLTTSHPHPTSTAAAFVVPAGMPVTAAPVIADPETYEQVQADIAAKAAAQAAQAAADAAAAQAATDAAAAAAKAIASKKAATNDPAPNGPVKCPAGSSANSNDGVNDTSCFPDICFHISVPDPAHPECDVAFKP